MITLSVPVSTHTVSFINRMVQRGVASTKAEVVRQALARYAEDKAIEDVLIAQQTMREGKGVSGDLRTILATME